MRILKDWRLYVASGVVVIGVGAVVFWPKPQPAATKAAPEAHTTQPAPEIVTTTPAQEAEPIVEPTRQSVATSTLNESEPTPDVRAQVRAEFSLGAPQEPAEWECFSKIVDELNGYGLNGWSAKERALLLTNYVKTVQLKSYCGNDGGLLFKRLVVAKFCNNDVNTCKWE